MESNTTSEYSKAVDKALLLFMVGKYNDFLLYVINECDVKIISREMILLMSIACENMGDKNGASKYKKVLMDTIDNKAVRM